MDVIAISAIGAEAYRAREIGYAYNAALIVRRHTVIQSTPVSS